MRSFLGVPILLRGEAYGNLYLTEKEGAFDDDDEEALDVLADWAAIAIENARAYSRMQERRDELERAVASFEATTEISHALAGDTDLEHVLELTVKRGRALTDARAMVLLLEDGEDLVVAALAGDLEEALLGERIRSRKASAVMCSVQAKLSAWPMRRGACGSRLRNRHTLRPAYSFRFASAARPLVCWLHSTA